MANKKPWYLNACMLLCNLLSHIIAAIHYCIIDIGVLKTPQYLTSLQGNVYGHLQKIWHARLVRRIVSVLVRSPFNSSTLSLINITVPLPTDSGCIIVTCHTPWKRLLVQWCLKNDFALIISNSQVTCRSRLIQRNGAGFIELRDLVKYLQGNGRIILTVDVFDNLKNCPVQFLGKEHNASLLPVRLARVADVPLIVAIPTLHNGSISFINGPQFKAQQLKSNPSNVIQNIMSFLEDQIVKNPSIWPAYVK
jgi:hypothetical protein